MVECDLENREAGRRISRRPNGKREWNDLVVIQLQVGPQVCIQCFLLTLNRRFVGLWPRRLSSTFVNDPIRTAACDVFDPDQPPGQIS